MIEDWDEDEARESAEEEWDEDTKGEPALSETRFKDAIYECAHYRILQRRTGAP